VVELRNTLRCFLKSGNSRLAAARELRLAPNTVAYRVARAAELLGRPAAERPTETLKPKGMPKVSRADVADFLVGSLTDSSWSRRIAILAA
jgi:hypothetical protein